MTTIKINGKEYHPESPIALVYNYIKENEGCDTVDIACNTNVGAYMLFVVLDQIPVERKHISGMRYGYFLSPSKSHTVVR